MVKPKTKPKKTPPANDDVEPTPSVVPMSAFSIGDRVHHPMFGDGKVEGIEDNKLTIAFEGHVTKVIREDFVTRKRDNAAVSSVLLEASLNPVPRFARVNETLFNWGYDDAGHAA
jgi:hypothetical protein